MYLHISLLEVSSKWLLISMSPDSKFSFLEYFANVLVSMSAIALETVIGRFTESLTELIWVLNFWPLNFFNLDHISFGQIRFFLLQYSSCMSSFLFKFNSIYINSMFLIFIKGFFLLFYYILGSTMVFVTFVTRRFRNGIWGSLDN